MHPTDTSMQSDRALPSNDNWVCLDPWDDIETGQQSETDNWLLGYVDMLTLMLTLLVMLLAFNQIENKHPELARIKNARETDRETRHAQQTKAGFLDSDFVDKRSGGLESVDKQTDRRLSILPVDQNNLDKSLLKGVSVQNEATGFLPDSNFRKQLNLNVVDEMDLSIDPIDVLDQSRLVAIEMQKPVPVEQTSGSDFEKARAGKPSKRQDIASFRRMIAKHKLDGLIDLMQTHNAVLMEVNERILFETGAAELKPKGKTLLDELAKLFRSQPGIIHVEGHTDNVPIATARFPSNWELSASRASIVARYLIDRTIDPDRLRAIGFADTKPRATNQTPEGRSKNRRVSFVIEMDEPPTAQKS